MGACSIYGNIEIGEIAAKSLFKLSEVYAPRSRCDGVAKLRKMITPAKLQMQRDAVSSKREAGFTSSLLTIKQDL